MKDRITQFLKSEKISPAEFADKINVQRSSVSHVLNGRNYPSASFIQKMLSAYPQLNSRWLLLGEGTILEEKRETYLASNQFSTIKSSQEAEIEILKDPAIDKHTNTVNTVVKDEDPAIYGRSIPLNHPKEENSSQKTLNFDHYIIGNKEVDRIVLFFKDKTFDVYTPSK